jgi:hypothetical protein
MIALTQSPDNGELRPRRLFDKIATRIFSEVEARRIDREGSSFVKRNTPEDYQSAPRVWRARTR